MFDVTVPREEPKQRMFSTKSKLHSTAAQIIGLKNRPNAYSCTLDGDPRATAGIVNVIFDLDMLPLAREFYSKNSLLKDKRMVETDLVKTVEKRLKAAGWDADRMSPRQFQLKLAKEKEGGGI